MVSVSGNSIKNLTFFMLLILKINEYATKAITYKIAIGCVVFKINKLTIT